jgi:hypothetical protein
MRLTLAERQLTTQRRNSSTGEGGSRGHEQGRLRIRTGAVRQNQSILTACERPVQESVHAAGDQRDDFLI